MPGHWKIEFDHNGPADEAGNQQPDDRDQRKQRVAKYVNEDNSQLGESLARAVMTYSWLITSSTLIRV